MQINMSGLQWKQPEQSIQTLIYQLVFWRPPAHFFSPSSSYLLQALFLLLLLMLISRHLQKVLFTADEAHRASHPSKARARTSKPIQTKLQPSVRVSHAPAGSLLWLYSAQAGDECAQPLWHHCLVSRVLKGGFFLKKFRTCFQPPRADWLPQWGGVTSHCRQAEEDKQVACSAATFKVLLSLSLSLTHSHTHTDTYSHTHTFSFLFYGFCDCCF